jgi:type II secretory pathway pseudopilin PulG
VIRLRLSQTGARVEEEPKMNIVPIAVRGFSLVEILVIVAVIGVVSTVAIPLVTGVPEAAKKEKLEQDVVVVNNAIDSYLALGGDEGQLTAANVLTALKSRVYGGMPAEMIGPQGPFLDPTVATNATDFSWSAVFTTEPRPRFVVERSTAGVIFGKGPTAEIGELAEQVDEARPSWLWSYVETQPSVASAEIFRPSAAAEAPSTFSPTALSKLQSPGFEPSGGTFPLAAFSTMELELSDPNPAGSSRIFFSTDEGASWSAYQSPLPIVPGLVAAGAVSLDPSRYSNSDPVTQIYKAQPQLTWSNTSTPLTYAQVASGAYSLSVTADGAGPFAIYYTTDGTTPTAESTSVAAGSDIVLQPSFWTSANLALQAKAITDTNDPSANYYVDSEVVPAEPIEADPEPLGAPVITPGSQIVFGSIPVSIAASADSPEGTRIYYTYSTDPAAVPTPETGVLYASPFVVSEFGVNQLKYVKAQAYAPADFPDFWFEASGVAEETYQGLNFDYYNLEGVLVGGGNIANNAALDGSVVLVSVDGLQPNVTFNNNSVLTGDIYAPGTPAVTGVPTNRIFNLDGAITPTNYTVNIQKADFAGKVYRRITPVTMPVVSLPTGLTNYGSISAGTQTLQPGYYTSVTLNNGGEITIGVPGATQPSSYVFDVLSMGNNVKIKVVGPVTLTLNPGVANTVTLGNGVVMGNIDHPEWLQVNMFTGNIRVGNNSTMYGSILNPNGTVSFQQNSTFVGGVTAKYINIENNATGVSFSLPPPTVSPTPAPTPRATPSPTP